MNDQRNMILAVVLSAIVLFGWSFVSERWFPTANPPPTKIVEGKEVPLPTPQDSVAPAEVRSIQEVGRSTPRIAIETPRLKGSINLVGARIDDLVLITHTQSIARNAPPVRLLAPAGTRDAYFATFGFGQGTALPGANTQWTTAAGARLTPSTPVTLRTQIGERIFEIVLKVDKDYLFTAEQRVFNRGSGDVVIRPSAVISRARASEDADSWTSHVGAVGVFNGAANYSWGYDDLKESGTQRFPTTGGWLGFGDKYWLTAIIPPKDSRVDAGFLYGGRSPFEAVFVAEPIPVPAGGTARYESRLFAGAKEIQLLDHYEDDLGVARFDKAIDWGWFEWFMKPIFSLLNWLFAQIGNFGVAIICLTLIVRTLMFPIAQKQFASMAGMRVVQPKMKALQDRYKDDKPKLQQEMLKLYKEEKVNPMAGCLPILIQIPVFYALYKVLMVSVEMRHQPFVLWIKDLSAPDPLTPVNLFGFLPFQPPYFLALGVLPILLGVTMYLQFKLNPPPADPIQKQMFAIMPWVLMFVMAPFAAGLQLYWVVNNILTILQQKWLYSRHPGMKAAAEST